jgi:hypothetical protein
MEKKNGVDKKKYHIIECPHCEQCIMIYQKDLKCRVFRCGIYKKNNKPIPPHSKKEKCEELVAKGLIYGCGKPFKMNKDNKPEIYGYK